MGLKFRKRITVFPGFKLNFSKSGISSTIGIRGLNLNFNKTGSYLNLGLPSSGLYDRIKLEGNGKNTEGNIITEETREILENEIKSIDIGKMSDEVGEQIKNDIKESSKQRASLKNDILIIKIKIFLLGFVYYVMFGFLLKNYKIYFQESKKLLKEIEYVYSKSGVDLEYAFDSDSEDLYNQLQLAFTELMKSKKVWDITSTKENNGVADRSGASNLITRKVTSIKKDKLGFINTDVTAFKFINQNGGDIYIYPGYVIIKKEDDMDIFEISRLNIDYYENRFIEEENVPKDTEILDYTWKYVNKSGTPDKRYNDNKQIPIVNYGNILLTSDTGLCEEFSYSSAENLMNFGNRLEEYLNYLNNGRKSINIIRNNIVDLGNDNDYISGDDNDYFIIKCENGKSLNTQKNTPIYNDIENQRQLIYDRYGKLSVKVEEIKASGEHDRMMDFEKEVHNTFNDDILHGLLDKKLINSIDPVEERTYYSDDYSDTYKYMGKLVDQKTFINIEKSLLNNLNTNKDSLNNYVYDLYAKSLRRIGNYYKKQKQWKEALSIFKKIDDMGFSGINDKKSLIKITDQLKKT